MALPVRRNGMMDEGEEEEALIPELDSPPNLGQLAYAAEVGDVDALRRALDRVYLSESIDEPVEDGNTALHLSCAFGHLPCVQLLLERGASFNVNPECVKRMLESVDVKGETPLHFAAKHEHMDVIRLLLSAGASPLKKNNNGKTPGELCGPDTEARRVLEAAASALACPLEILGLKGF